MEYVTKEEFERYKQLSEKKKELEELRPGLHTFTGFLCGGTAGLAGFMTYKVLAEVCHPYILSPFSTFEGIAISVIFGITTLACGGASYAFFKEASQVRKKVKGLEKEIAELEKE